MCKAKTIAKFVGTFKLKKHEGMADMIKAMGINQVHIKRAEKLPQTLVLDVKDDHFIHEHKFGPISVRQKFKIGEPFQSKGEDGKPNITVAEMVEVDGEDMFIFTVKPTEPGSSESVVTRHCFGDQVKQIMIFDGKDDAKATFYFQRTSEDKNT